MIRALIILMLVITGAGAVYGGIVLISDPSGWKLGLHTGMLQFSPFSDFLVPGLILVFVLGLGSLFVSTIAILKAKKYATWVIFMGFIIAGWISIQILMIRDVQFLQIFFAFIGIMLVVLGILERRKEIYS
jgi:hypothetical protein